MSVKNIVIVLLLLLIIGMGGYLVYDKAFMNDECVIDSGSNINNNKIENDETDNYVADDSSNMDDNNEVGNVDSHYLITEIEHYKNVDGSYGMVEEILINFSDESYRIRLSLDGKIYVFDGNGNKMIDAISGVSDVVDIEKFGSYTMLGREIIYILTKSGDIYVYDCVNLLDEKYIALKVDGVNGIERIMKINWCPWENSGCAMNLVAVTNDGKIIKLESFSV